jgi:hypothetical protein
LIFNASQVAKFNNDKTKYIWGIFDDSGFDIEYTPAEYFDDFVYYKAFINYYGKVSYDMNFLLQVLIMKDGTVLHWNI